MKIIGISHPVPTKFAKRIYKNNKSVYLGKRFLNKVSKGDKFILYESQGERAYTGIADINFIGKMKKDEIIDKFENNLMVTKDEFLEYSDKNNEMVIIELENFRKFPKSVKPKRYVTVAGKYIYEDEFNKIIKKSKLGF